MTSITGLILHFRTPKQTINCLKSLLQEGIERVVIVDNSEDNGRSALEMSTPIKALQENGLALEIVNPQRNLGFAAGVNLGLRHINHTTPGHVLLINSDAQLSSGAIFQMKIDLESAHIIAPRISQGEQAPTSPLAYYDKLLGTITLTPILMPIPHLSGCCLLIREDLATPDLLDQDFFFYGEDVMLGFKAEKNNIIEKECAHAHISHETSSSAKNGSLFYEYHINRAHWLLAKKLAKSNLSYLLFTLARCITLPTRTIVRCIRLKSSLPLKGFYLATRDMITGNKQDLTPSLPENSRTD